MTGIQLFGAIKCHHCKETAQVFIDVEEAPRSYSGFSKWNLWSMKVRLPLKWIQVYQDHFYCPDEVCQNSFDRDQVATIRVGDGT